MTGMANVYGVRNHMQEPENFEASEFIADHYQNLVDYAIKVLGSDQFAVDLVNDVYISVRNSENNGEGHNPDGSRYVEDYSVSQWVKSRICRYAMNQKYHGVNKNEVTVGMEMPSDSEDGVSAVQRAYFCAPSADEIEDIELAVSVQEEVEYLFGFEGANGVSIKWVLSHVAELMEHKVDNSVFDSIRNLGSDVLEAIQDVLTFAMRNPDQYDSLLATVAAA